MTCLAQNICPVSQNRFKLHFEEGPEDLFLKELWQENIILYFCSASPHKNLWPPTGKMQLEINAIRLGIMIKGLDFHRVRDQQNYWTIPGELPTKVAKTCVTPESLGQGYLSLTVLWCSRKFLLSPPDGGDDAESSHLTFIFVKIIDPLKFWIRSIPGQFFLPGSTLTTDYFSNVHAEGRCYNKE